jgi:hypothetical protein
MESWLKKVFVGLQKCSLQCVNYHHEDKHNEAADFLCGLLCILIII